MRSLSLPLIATLPHGSHPLPSVSAVWLCCAAVRVCVCTLRHLLTFLELKQPGSFMRFCVFMSQGSQPHHRHSPSYSLSPSLHLPVTPSAFPCPLTSTPLSLPRLCSARLCVSPLLAAVFFNFFFLAYLVSPRYCHRLVGYLEEEAVKTYTEIIKLVDGRFIDDWHVEKPPAIAIRYWKMKEGDTVRDLLLMVRADESHHRDVNHCLADLNPDTLNPYGRGK